MKWVIRILQGLLALGFVMAGSSKFAIGASGLKETYTEPLGYSIEFMYVIALLECLAAIALIAGFWNALLASAGAFVVAVIMAGAWISVLAAGLSAGEAAPSFIWFVVAILLLVGHRKSWQSVFGQSQAG
jgi:uncharacterized membrane protein YphA (DoxX/SURF4 family)